MKPISWLLLIPVVLLMTSCLSSGSSDDSSTTPAGGGTGGSTTFTSADIAKAWVSDCIASTDSVIGTSYYKNYLTLYANGTFEFQQYLHTGAGGSNCNNANYVTVFTIYGAYSVGSVVSGSAQALAFSVVVSGGTAPDLMIVDDYNHTPSVTTIENAFNTDCGGTSPYCTIVSGTCTNNGTYGSGQHAASQHMSCMHYTFPNTGNSTLYNVATYDGTTLTMGAGLTGVPGVFNSNSIPTSVTVAYH